LVHHPGVRVRSAAVDVSQEHSPDIETRLTRLLEPAFDDIADQGGSLILVPGNGLSTGENFETRFDELRLLDYRFDPFNIERARRLRPRA